MKRIKWKMSILPQWNTVFSPIQWSWLTSSRGTSFPCRVYIYIYYIILYYIILCTSHVSTWCMYARQCSYHVNNPHHCKVRQILVQIRTTPARHHAVYLLFVFLLVFFPLLMFLSLNSKRILVLRLHFLYCILNQKCFPTNSQRG